MKFSFFGCFDIFENRVEDLDIDVEKYTGHQFKGSERSTHAFQFRASTPGDILGVNFNDPFLTREEMKRVSLTVFKNIHADRFSPTSSFARTYDIKTVEEANAAFSNYKTAYEEFMRVKGWTIKTL